MATATPTEKEMVIKEQFYTIELTAHEAAVLYLMLSRVEYENKHEGSAGHHIRCLQEAMAPDIHSFAMAFYNSGYFYSEGKIFIKEVQPLVANPAITFASPGMPKVSKADKNEVAYTHIFTLICPKDTAQIIRMLTGSIYGPTAKTTPRGVLTGIYNELGSSGLTLNYAAFSIGSSLYLYPEKRGD